MKRIYAMTDDELLEELFAGMTPREIADYVEVC
jgi:hypothetical protein